MLIKVGDTFETRDGHVSVVTSVINREVFTSRSKRSKCNFSFRTDKKTGPYYEVFSQEEHHDDLLIISHKAKRKRKSMKKAKRKKAYKKKAEKTIWKKKKSTYPYGGWVKTKVAA